MILFKYSTTLILKYTVYRGSPYLLISKKKFSNM